MTTKTATKRTKSAKEGEMTITLATLVEIGACRDARFAFAQEFGSDGAPTAKEVFRAIARGNRHDWLFWLAARLKGFAQAVGNESDGEYHCRIDGEFESNAGFMIAYDSATVRAYGSATVEAYDSATVEAYGSATVEAYGSATVEAYDSATVRAYGSATVEAYGSATVEAYGSATVEAYDSATVRAYGSATVRASGSATVEASDSATVEAYDSATVLLTRYSLSVSLVVKSLTACAVDRRNDGRPQLLLAEEAL